MNRASRVLCVSNVESTLTQRSGCDAESTPTQCRFNPKYADAKKHCTYWPLSWLSAYRNQQDPRAPSILPSLSVRKTYSKNHLWFFESSWNHFIVTRCLVCTWANRASVKCALTEKRIFISRGKVNNPVYIGHLPAGLAVFFLEIRICLSNGKYIFSS